MKKTTNVLWGIVLVALGVIIALNSFNITHIDIFFKGWWTLFIIIPCIVGLFKDEDKTGSIIGILVGVALFLGVRNILSVDILLKLALPVILVIIGISLILKDALNAETKKKIKEMNKGQKMQACTATFSSQDINFDGEKFNCTEANAIFGGVKLDLRKAVIESDCIINLCAIFGGVDILLPEDVNVKISSTSIFGGVSDKRENKTNKAEHTIYINATCMFGGADIK